MATPSATSKGRNKPAPRLLIMTAALGVLGVILLARTLHHDPRPPMATGTLGTTAPTGPAGALTPPPEGSGSVGTPGTTTTARETPTAAEISSALSGHPTSEPTSTSVPAATVPSATTDPSRAGVTPASGEEAAEQAPRKQTPSEEVAAALVTPDPALSSSFASKGTQDVSAGTGTTVQSAVQQAAPAPIQSVTPMAVPEFAPAAAPVVSAPVPLPVQPVQAAPVTYAPPRYVPPAPEVATPTVTPVPVTAQPVVVLPAPRPQSTGSAVAVTVLTPAPGETEAASTKPATPVTPTPEPVAYLGSVQSDGGQTIALLTVGGRDETVAAGQVIPGTTVKVVTVTPTQLTLRDASGTRTVSLQEAE